MYIFDCLKYFSYLCILKVEYTIVEKTNIQYQKRRTK